MPCCQAAKIVAQLVEAGHEDLADQFIDVVSGAPEEVIAEDWDDLPKGWTRKSLESFWESLTGDRKHKITACAKKMKGKVTDEWAFCASLARRVGAK